MNVTVGIMAHPDRRQLVNRLVGRGRLPKATQVAWDERNDRWDTGRRAILTHYDQPSAEYHLVLQDDALIPPNFMQGLRNALEAIPKTSPLVLFTTKASKWVPVFREIPDHFSYLVMDRIWWGVGIVYPTSTLPDLINYCDNLDTPQYDHRVGDFYHANNTPVYYTWPNLINHRAGPSLVKGRSGRRSSFNYSPKPAHWHKWDGEVLYVEPPPDIEVKV